MRKYIIFGLVALVFLILSSNVYSESDFPEHNLTFIQFNDPGSSGDMFVRTLCKVAEPHFGKPIKIITRTGGNGADAISLVMKAPADGYTLSQFTASMTGYMNMPGFPGKPNDFDYLLGGAQYPYMLCINSKLPIKNIDDFIKYLKKKPNGLTVSGSRVGSVHHQNIFFMAKEAGVKVNYLPCKGGSAALKEALGGHVDGVNYTTFKMLPYVKKGILRPIVVFSYERDSEYPDVPTIKEAGFKMEPVIQVDGVMLKKGVPPHIKYKIFKALCDATEEPEYKEFLKRAHKNIRLVLPQDFAANYLRQVQEAKSYMKEIGILK